jgi:hypothetical protein
MPWKKRDRATEIHYSLADAGPDLDRRIEERVAEVLHRSPVPWKNPPPYSADLPRAQFLLDVMERREFGHTSVAETPSGWACSMQVGDGALLVGRGDTEALAICAVFMTERERVRARRPRGGIVTRTGKRVRRFARRLSRNRFVSRVTFEIRRILFP